MAGMAVSPLASYSTEWNDAKYTECNTAVNASYINSEEKEVIYILNLIRSNPKLFANTVLKKYPAVSGKDQLVNDTYYYGSLMEALRTMKPLGILYPDNDCYTSAECHATTSGKSGYIGH
ncbi:MAG TPA: hypothetical protein VK484_13045, partial [Ferruginibacter sp.]|nr:hypothetical protein [Ferruginibacter sp.]